MESAMISSSDEKRSRDQNVTIIRPIKWSTHTYQHDIYNNWHRLRSGKWYTECRQDVTVAKGGYINHTNFRQLSKFPSDENSQGWDENSKPRQLFVWKMDDSGPLTNSITDYSPFPAHYIWCAKYPVKMSPKISTFDFWSLDTLQNISNVLLTWTFQAIMFVYSHTNRSQTQTQTQTQTQSMISTKSAFANANASKT